MLQPTTFALYPDKGGDKEGKTTGSEGSCSCSLKITWANECEIKEVGRSNARPFKRPHLQSDAVKIYILGANVIWGFSWVTLALVWSANVGISRCSDTERRDVSRALTWRPAGYSTPADLQDHELLQLTRHVWRLKDVLHFQCLRHPCERCGLWYSQKSCAFPLDTKISRFVYFICLLLHISPQEQQHWQTTVTPRNKILLKSSTTCQNDGFKKLFYPENQTKESQTAEVLFNRITAEPAGTAVDVLRSRLQLSNCLMGYEILHRYIYCPQNEERRRDCMNCEELMVINLITYHRTNPPELIFTFLEHYPYLHINTTFISQNVTISM